MSYLSLFTIFTKISVTVLNVRQTLTVTPVARCKGGGVSCEKVIIAAQVIPTTTLESTGRRELHWQSRVSQESHERAVHDHCKAQTMIP